MNVAETRHRTQTQALDLLYPPHCVACERVGAWLCDDCAASITPLPTACCPRCGRPMPTSRLCRTCRGRRSPLQALRSLGSYTSPLREAVHALKYDGLAALADPLAALLETYWRQAPLPVTVLAPVPLHRGRVRYRGYNQAALLASAFGSRVGLPVVEDCLVRRRATRSQVGLSVADRHANVNEAFCCVDERVRGERVLLIDDVCTTGATLAAAAQALLDGGASSVWALTLARAPFATVR